MGAEEKKSSHKPESGPSQNRQTHFRLHCFPDITVEDPDDARVCTPLDDKFHRIQYDDESNCPAGFPDNANPETRSPKRSSAVEKFDVQAYRKGFSDGVKKGIEEGQTTGFEQATKKLEPLLNGLQQALAQLGSLRQHTYQIIEQEVVELALAIARKIICREIEVDREVVLCVARKALSKIEDPSNVKIKMNPADLRFINQTKYKISEMIGNMDNVTIEPGENIQSGGCVIETNLGEIDARIEKQLQTVEESFRTALENMSAKFQPGQAEI